MSGGKRPKGRHGRVVDMSVPVDQRRRRRRQGTVGGTPPAQMSHASGRRAARWEREGRQRLEAERQLHTAEEAAEPEQEEDPDDQLAG